MESIPLDPLSPQRPGEIRLLRKFVEQDRRTMELQAEGLKHNPHLMLIDDADRPAKWYFQLKSAHLESKRAGTELKHPMAGPITLKWRS